MYFNPRKEEYKVYLLSEHWKSKRNEILSARGCKCEKCGEWGNEIHHLNYNNLWGEKPEDLQVLCGDCHEATHRALRSINKGKRYNNKKKKIHRRALYSALSEKQKQKLIKDFNLTDEELYAFILYSNSEEHYEIIKTASRILGFDGFHPKIVKQQSNNYRPNPYKNKPARKPMVLF